MLLNHRNGTVPGPKASSPSATVLEAQAAPQPGTRPVTAPDPQVVEKASRRRFSNGYKRRILKEADACTKPGQLGALLRREGLYSSSLATFRKQQAEGHLAERNEQQVRAQRNERAAERQKAARRLAHLEQENRQLRALLEIQKKLSDLLGIALETQEASENIV